MNAPRWFVVSAAIVLLVGPEAGQTLAGSVPKALIDRAARDGTVRVIVQLYVAATPEGELRGTEAVVAQRKAIAAAQSALMVELVGTGHRLNRAYETIPFLALEVSSNALRTLEASALVVGVEEDHLELPLSTPSRPAGANLPPRQR